MKIIAYHPSPEELEKLCYHLINEGENLVAFTWSPEHFQTLVSEQKNRAALLVIDPNGRTEGYSRVFPDNIRLEPQPQSAPVLMRRAGYMTHSSVEQWESACVIRSGLFNAEDVCTAAKTFFSRHNPGAISGLEEIPTCWLAQLPTLVAEWMELKNTGQVVEIVTHANVISGVLDLQFATRGVFPDIQWLSRLDEFRIWLNLRLQPNRFSEGDPALPPRLGWRTPRG